MFEVTLKQSSVCRKGNGKSKTCMRFIRVLSARNKRMALSVRLHSYTGLIMALYIVPTPIGNLGDITRRAVEVLARVDFIIAEDSRYSLKLLNHLGIKKRIVSHYRPKEETQAEKIVAMLAAADGALVTDSGTPAISDPGVHPDPQGDRRRHPGHPPARADRLRSRPGRLGDRPAPLPVPRLPAAPPRRARALPARAGAPAVHPGLLRVAAPAGGVPGRRLRRARRPRLRRGQGAEQAA